MVIFLKWWDLILIFDVLRIRGEMIIGIFLIFILGEVVIVGLFVYKNWLYIFKLLIFVRV